MSDSIYKDSDDSDSKSTLEHTVIKDEQELNYDLVQHTNELLQLITSCQDLVLDPNIPIYFQQLAEISSKSDYQIDPNDFFESHFLEMMVTIKDAIPETILQNYFKILENLSGKYSDIAKFLAENAIPQFCFQFIHSDLCIKPIILSCFNILSNLLPFMDKTDVVEMPISTPQILANIKKSLPMFLSLISFHGKLEEIDLMVSEILLMISKNLVINLNTPHTVIQTLANIVSEVILNDPTNILYVLHHPQLPNIESNLFHTIFMNTDNDDMKTKILLLKCIGYSCSSEYSCFDLDFIHYIKNEVTIDWIYDNLMITRNELFEDEEEDIFDDSEIFSNSNPLTQMSEEEKEETIKQLILSSLYCLRQLSTRSEFNEDFSYYLTPEDIFGLMDLYHNLPSKGKEHLMIFLFKLCSLTTDNDLFMFCFEKGLIELIADATPISPEMTVKMSAFIYYLFKNLSKIGFVEPFLNKLEELDFFNLMQEQDFDDDESEETVKKIYDFLSSQIEE